MLKEEATVKKRFVVLLALSALCLALALTLLPAREAHADYKIGDTCPRCGTGKLYIWGGSNSTHSFYCSNKSCEIDGSAINRFITERHYGGAATCTSGPICDGCGYEYGQSLGYDTHDWGPWVDQGDGTHKRTCKRNGCGVFEVGNHSGGTATCVSGPICAACGKEYGEKDPNTHGGTITPASCKWQAFCSGCEQFFGEKDPNNHRRVTAATCVEQNYCQDCQSYFGDVNPNNHKGFFSRLGRIEPTCTAVGHEEGVKCNACDSYTWGGTEISKDPDAHTGMLELVGEIPATCTTPGQKAGKRWSCCGAYAEGGTEIPVDSTAHDWGDWEKMNDNYHKHTCQRQGCVASEIGNHAGSEATCVAKAHCDACNSDYGQENPNNHPAYLVVAATCVDPAHCNGCGNEYGDTDPNNHVGTHEDVEEIPATCTTPGRKAGEMWICCGVYTKGGEEIPVDRNAHNWGAWTYVDEAAHKHTCQRQGCTAEETGRHSGGTATCQAQAVCSVCQQAYGDLGAHDWGAWEKVDDQYHRRTCRTPGCTASETEEHIDKWNTYCGRQPHCDACNADFGTVPAHDMIYEDRGKDGHKPSCRRCDTNFDVEAHVPGEPKQENYVAVSCTTDGSYDEVIYCTLCQGQVSSTHRTISAAHDFTVDVAEKPATCTEAGYTAHKKCSRCDAKNEDYRVLNALDHDWSDWVSDATCTAAGTERRACRRQGCGVEESRPAAALGHALVHHEGQAATCTVAGWADYDTCERCDYSTYAPIPAKGHTEVTDPAVAPTCTETGLTEGKHCSVCDAVLTAQEEVPALGHDLVHHDAQAETCTEIGWEAYDTCSRCDYTTYEEIPALGHAEVIDEAVDPTCTETGLTEGKHCSRCNAILTAQEEVPALGHDYHAAERTITRVRYTCSRCHAHRWQDNPHSESLLPGLLLDQTGADLPYAAGVTRENGTRILTVTPETDAAPSLRLTPAQVAAWLQEGLGLVRLQLDQATLEIELDQIGPAWFPSLTGDPDRVLFTLTPGEGTLEVLVEALQGDDRTPAASLTGLKLKAGETLLPVETNGTYTVS